MKRLKISSLMDEYTDTEFFPTGGSVADSEAVKERVLAQVNVSASAKKKQTPRKKKVLLAAALAAAMVLLMGAGYPFFQRQLVKGSLTFGQEAAGRYVSYVESCTIVQEENGRLFFASEDGQRVDITDLVSEETPYIYDGSDPDTGLTYYIIMGGTPECYGWLTWISMPNPMYEPKAYQRKMTTAYHYYISDIWIGCQTGQMGLDVDAVEWKSNMGHPWLLAGAERLGITFLPTEEYEAMVENGTR